MALNFITPIYQIILATLKLIQILSCDVWLNLRDVNNIRKNNILRKSTAIVTDRKINFNCQQSQNRMKIIQKAASKRKKIEENRNQTEQEKS